MAPTDRSTDRRPSAGSPLEAELGAERDAALARVRDLEHELGRLRGQLRRLEALSTWRRAWRRVATAVPYRLGRLRHR